ncbi:tetratricopeptide repeat protein [Nostocales cyanobacterium LEGE 12452]|nr:tetratricopeptide repeat protein [Nostocales cyanobacterium LEGE 12452]
MTTLLAIAGLWVLMPKLTIGQLTSPLSTNQSAQLAEAKRLEQQAEKLSNEGKYGEAIPLVERVLAIRKQTLGDEHPDVATSLNNLAFLYREQGHYKRAEPLYRQALEMYKRLLGNEHPGVANTLNNLAVLYSSQGRYEQAEPLYHQALEMYKRLLGNEHPDVANTLNNLAFLYREQGRYEQAEPLFRQALEMYKRLLGNEHPDVATSLNHLADMYSIQGRYEQAEPLFRQALEMRKRLLGDEHPDVATSLNNLAFLYKSQGRYKQAEPLYHQALEMYKRLLGNEHPDVATSLSNLAGLYSSQGRYEQAEPLYRQALEMRKRLLGNEHPDVAYNLNNLAGLYSSQGRYEQAEPLYHQALEMRKRLLGEKHPLVATSLNNLAGLYSSQGRYADAEPLFRQALEMSKSLLGNEHPDVAYNLNNLAFLYSNQRRYADAEPLYRQALEMSKRLLGEEHPLVATSLNNLAVLYSNQGRYDQAEPLYRQALEIRKRLLGNEHPLVAADLHNLAGLYWSQGRYDQAELLYRHALEMRKRLLGNEHPDVAANLNNLAGLYWRRNDTNHALDFLTLGLKVEEHNLTLNLATGFERQKRDYIRTISGTTNFTISLHLYSAANNPKATRLALSTVLQRKGRILDVLTNSQQILRQRLDTKSQDLLTNLANTQTQLAHLFYNRPKTLPLKQYQTQVAQLETQAKQLEDQLSRRSQEFRTQSQAVNLESIQRLIPADAALVELVRYRPFNPKGSLDKPFGKPRYAVYVLPAKGEAKGIDLDDAETIQKTIELFRDDLRDQGTNIDQVKNSARELDKILMQPVRKLLGSTRKILLSPDSELNLIPFEALVDENNRYLVENYSFTYLTSGRDLLRLQNQSPSKQSPVLIADPNFNRPGEIVARQPNSNSQNIRSIDLSQKVFSPLPGTAEEAKAIANILKVKPMTGTKATEGVVKQVKSPRILHIATHGFFENAPANKEKTTVDDNPLLLSGLVLAGLQPRQSGGEDGILSALETSLLNLVGTKLVVLSACDTGLGKIFVGEGIYGLRRALVIAGSESQMISLWKVDDDATKELMVAYYKKLLDNQGRSEALRQTQLEMLKGEKYQHPYYWAAFIPSGYWTPMDK